MGAAGCVGVIYIVVACGRFDLCVCVLYRMCCGMVFRCQCLMCLFIMCFGGFAVCSVVLRSGGWQWK